MAAKVTYLLLTIILTILGSRVSCSTERTNPANINKAIPSIAVIGAGIGGASSTHFLRQLFQTEVEIDVFEKDKVGGRLSTGEVDGQFYEIGGSALHPKNKYMMEFLKTLGLKKRHVFGIRLGQFDGKQFLVMEGDRPINSFGKLFHRYGNSISNWHTVIDQVLSHFLRIYEVQNRGYAFSSVDKLLTSAHPGLLNLTKVTASRYLLQNDLLPVFVNEVATGITRICYGQNTDINALAGTISLAGAKAGLWGVKGGNIKLPQLLIERAKIKPITNSKVTDVSLMANGKFQIITNGGPTKKEYDMVIVATPLIQNVSQIKFHNFPSNIGNFKGKYQQSVTTLVDGKLKSRMFNVENNKNNNNNEADDIQEILTTHENNWFNSISRIYPVDQDEEWNASSTVWKVVSEKALKNEELDEIFEQRKTTLVKSWLAYPHYNPPDQLGPFVLYPGLFYTSAIEWAASAMEMSAIAGKNAALLAYYHWIADETLVDSCNMHKDEL
ncbi:Prenylcysteine oxidase-like [Chamberlinius hualienensis]